MSSESCNGTTPSHPVHNGHVVPHIDVRSVKREYGVHFLKQCVPCCFDAEFCPDFKDVITLNLVKINAGQTLNVVYIDSLCVNHKFVLFNSNIHFWNVTTSFDRRVEHLFRIIKELFLVFGSYVQMGFANWRIAVREYCMFCEGESPERVHNRINVETVLHQGFSGKCTVKKASRCVFGRPSLVVRIRQVFVEARAFAGDVC